MSVTNKFTIQKHNSDGTVKTRAQIAKVVTEIYAKENGGYSASTFSQNYVSNVLASRRHKYIGNNCNPTDRKKNIQARLSMKLMAKQNRVN